MPPGSVCRSNKPDRIKKIVEPFDKFSANKSIDGIIYLCNYLCDGYQSPIFPEDTVTNWHIWHAIRLAEKHQKPLVIGHQNDFCFRAPTPEQMCYEARYVTDPEKIKCPTKTIHI